MQCTQASAAITSLSAVPPPPNNPSLPHWCVVAGLETGTVSVFRCRAGGQQHQEKEEQQRFFPPLSPPPPPDDDTPPHEQVSSLLTLVDLGMGGGLSLPQCGWSGPLSCCTIGQGCFAVAGRDGRMGVGGIGVGGSSLDDDQLLEWRALWGRQTPHPFFAVAPLEGDSWGGFAACGWSGVTWLVRSVLGRKGEASITVLDAAPMLHPPLRGFTAGRFGSGSNGKPPPFCLFYSCGDGKVRVFHDVLVVGGEEGESSAAVAWKTEAAGVKELVRAWCDVHVGRGEQGDFGVGDSDVGEGAAPVAAVPAAGGGGEGGRRKDEGGSGRGAVGAAAIAAVS